MATMQQDKSRQDADRYLDLLEETSGRILQVVAEDENILAAFGEMTRINLGRDLDEDNPEGDDEFYRTWSSIEVSCMLTACDRLVFKKLSK